jgi:hypothetical protein
MDESERIGREFRGRHKLINVRDYLFDRLTDTLLDPVHADLMMIIDAMEIVAESFMHIGTGLWEMPDYWLSNVIHELARKIRQKESPHGNH